MKELLDFDTPTQVRVDTYTTAQEPELCAEKGTQVSMLPECKNARVQTSQRTKTVGKFTRSLILSQIDTAKLTNGSVRHTRT